MGSGKKVTKTEQKYTPPSWIQSRSQQAAGLASDYARQPYQAYTGDRVAGLAGAEQQGIDLAREGVGAYKPDIDAARGALEGMQDFTQADMQAYMNPYIKGALDPAARELREDTARRRNEMVGGMDAAGAYGSRAALALREVDEAGFQEIGDLYGRGYAEAFDRGSALWQADQNRKLQQSQQFLQVAGMGSDLMDRDFQRLMESGETARYVDQMMKDFDYEQFVEGRDWGGRQAAYLTDVLRGLKGSYAETQEGKTTTKEKGNVLGQIMGAGMSIMGSYFMGGK